MWPETVRLHASTASRSTSSAGDGSLAASASCSQRLIGNATKPMTVPAPASAVRVWIARSRSLHSMSSAVVSPHMSAVSMTPATNAGPNRRSTAATQMLRSV